jgi:Tol biopolymer transport system component
MSEVKGNKFMQIRFLILVLISGIALVRCADRSNGKMTIIYPEPKPDTTALRFLPGIVCSENLDFNSCFSPDGRTFYFARSHNGKYLLLETEFNGKDWSAATPVTFVDTTYSNADPFIASDGSLYFISDMPKDPNDTARDFDIWLVKPIDSTWSKPVNVTAVNSDSTEYYVSLAANGNLYFASNREGGVGEHDIYVSRMIDGHYSSPENLGAAINSTNMEHDPLISPDEKLLIFTTIGRQDGFGEADLITPPGTTLLRNGKRQ